MPSTEASSATPYFDTSSYFVGFTLMSDRSPYSDRQTKWPSTRSSVQREVRLLLPFHVAGGQFDTPQFSVGVVAAAAPVNEAVDVDRRVPVALQRLVEAILVRVCPDLLRLTAFQVQQHGPGTVTLAQENLVADHDRSGGVDALLDLAPATDSWNSDLAGLGVEAERLLRAKYSAGLLPADAWR